jgi:hypothetical protein
MLKTLTILISQDGVEILVVDQASHLVGINRMLDHSVWHLEIASAAELE